jgi:hypothetical protein
METLSLSCIAYGLGVFFVLFNLPFILSPDATRRALQWFPRSTIPAWILTLLDLSWFGWLLYHEPLWQFFDYVRPWLWLIMPVLTILVCVFVDELLAARALGGLLLLVAGPILDAARFHPSLWRYLPIVMAYAWIAGGIIFVLAPYRVRRFFEFITRTDLRCRVGGGVRLAVGLLYLWLGWNIF